MLYPDYDLLQLVRIAEDKLPNSDNERLLLPDAGVGWRSYQHHCYRTEFRRDWKQKAQFNHSVTKCRAKL